MANATISAVAISPKCRVASASKWLAAQAGQTWWTCLLIKKNSAYPVATASNTAHQEEAPKLSGKIAKIVTPRSVPAAKLISAQSCLCASCSDVLIHPPATAKTYAATTCQSA